jgi:PAS domain S-box-containing protein
MNKKFTKLRHQAEKKLKNQPESQEKIPDAIPSGMQLLHELRVHQVELEAQNEELRRSQLELKAAKARYFDLYNLAPVGHCTLDEEGKILESNFTTSSLLGLNVSKLLKRPLTDFISKEDQDIYYLFKKQIIANGQLQSTELRITRHDGSEFWGRLEGIAAKDQDNRSIIRMVISDVSLREQQLLTINKELINANNKLESFNYSVTHDLRSPLSAIMGFTKIMMEENNYKNLNDENKDALSRVLGATKKMELVIDGLLKISRITRIVLDKSPVELSAMVHGIAGELQLLDPKRKISFIIPENIMANGDAELLMIVLTNLMNNAYKFTSNKTDTIIEFGKLDKNTYFLRDNGVGFDMRHRDKLFKPFERLHSNTEFPGTGIGLASAARAIERHSGKIWAEGAVNAGATFYFNVEKS